MAPEDKSPASNNLMLRVKVYRMNGNGKWDDQGTGHVTVDYLERSDELALFVIDEEDNETLLLHRISSDDIYRKQEDTIISWRDPEYSTELALSFQETTGCSYIWDHISSMQRTYQFSALNNEMNQFVTSDLKQLPGQLPPVELSTLPLILKTVVESGVGDQLHVTDLILHNRGFFRKLMDLFRICEDLKNIGALHLIFKVVRGIILFNNPQIFEKILGDNLILDIIGSLEYDPEASHVHHHNFLKEHVVFKEAIPIKDPLVLSKMHQTYRVGYLKDVVFHRSMDNKATISGLNTIIHSNNAIVVSLLKDDSTFFQELFARLKSDSVFVESKKKLLVFFLHEFCCLSKSLQMGQQMRLSRDLMNEGIFDIIADILRSDDKKLVSTGYPKSFLASNPSLMRSYVIRQEGVPLLGLLVKGMITDVAGDLHCQFLEILRILLDSFTQGSWVHYTIIEVFYEKHLGQLVDVITSSCPLNGVSQSASKSGGSGTIGSQICLKPEILLNICDLLCYCILHHPFRIKCNFLLSNLIDKVLLLTQRREKYLVLAAVRFVRILISCNDEHVSNHIVKKNLLNPIVDAFIANGNRYNLLQSAILELFEHIRKDNLKILLKYLVVSFWDKLVKFEVLPSIHSLKLTYNQSLENPAMNPVMKNSLQMLDSRKRKDECALVQEGKGYLNEESGEEDAASVSTPKTISLCSQSALSNRSAANSSSLSAQSSGLVDCADDEDDKE